MGRPASPAMRESGDRPARLKQIRPSREELRMRMYVSGPLTCCCLFPALLSAAQVKGTVVDPSGAPVAGAQVSVVGRVGVEAQTAASSSGAFVVEPVQTAGAKRVDRAPGFSTRTRAWE